MEKTSIVLGFLGPIKKEGKFLTGVGERVLIMKMSHNLMSHHGGVSAFCGIGEQRREGEEFYREIQ